jgi:quercetin dioxygenase-like cupin family protein
LPYLQAGPATGAPETRWFFVKLARVLLTAEDTDGTLGIVELTGTQGEMPPLHAHHREDETFVVLEGELTLFTPAGSRTVAAGEAALAPIGIPHAYRVESEEARWLAVSRPAGFATFVLAASEPAGYDGVPSADRSVDMEALLAVAAEHGIEILAPPGTTP